MLTTVKQSPRLGRLIDIAGELESKRYASSTGSRRVLRTSAREIIHFDQLRSFSFAVVDARLV